MQSVCEIRVRLGAACVFAHVFLELDGQQFPFTVVYIRGEIVGLSSALKVHPEATVDPRTKAQNTQLVVEGEIRDVHFTGTLELDRHWPDDGAVSRQDDVHSLHEASRSVISAISTNEIIFNM